MKTDRAYEATKHLSKPLKEQYPDIPWRNIAGLRDILIHNYMGVDLESVWNVIENDLPSLKEQLGRIITNSELAFCASNPKSNKLS